MSAEHVTRARSFLDALEGYPPPSREPLLQAMAENLRRHSNGLPPLDDLPEGGHRLQVAREAAGLTREDVAKAARIKVRALRAYERGEREPQAATLRRWEDAVAELATKENEWETLTKDRPTYYIDGFAVELPLGGNDYATAADERHKRVAAATTDDERWELVKRQQENEMRLRYRRLGETHLEPQRHEAKM